jgi:hypothetical protein
MVIFHSYVSLPEGNTYHFPPNASPVFSALGFNGICAGYFRGDQPQRRAESTETVRLGTVMLWGKPGGVPQQGIS